MTTTKDIINILNEIAPFEIAEKWDNSGLQAGNPDWEVNRILVGLDVNMPLMQAAVDLNADLVVTHHPLMIQGVNSLNFATLPGNVIQSAARNKISIVAAHTNLDKAIDGLNDFFAYKIGIQKTDIFFIDQTVSMISEQPIGIGRIGRLEKKISLQKLGELIKEKLNVPYLRITGNLTDQVKSIAICTGSGGSLIDEFLNSGADVFVTGDIKYHEARLVEQHSRGLIDVGHFGSEVIAIDLLSQKLEKAFQTKKMNIDIKEHKSDKDPFIIV